MQSKSFTDLAVKRPNESLAINPKKGRITLGTRRLFNLLLFFSQKDGVQEVYSRSISEVMRHMNSSKDTEWLKDCFRSMQETLIEWNNKEGRVESWGVSGLISEARIITDVNTSIIMWSLPRIIRERLADPRFFTKITLEIYSKLRTGASIALYEICSRYLTNPSQVTNRDHWEWWEPRLTGNPLREKSEYRYFSRDVLRPAIAEVNRISDIDVELIEYKNGRKIADIQFKVTKKLTELIPAKEVPNQLEIDLSLLESIASLGLSFEEAKEVCSKHELPFVRDTVFLAKKRVANTKLEPLNSVPAFFKSALIKGYALAKPAIKKKISSDFSDSVSDGIVINENRNTEVETSHEASLTQKAIKEWENKSSADRLILLNEFSQSTPNNFYVSDINRRGAAAMVSRTLQTAFGDWYSKKLWGTELEENNV